MEQQEIITEFLTERLDLQRRSLIERSSTLFGEMRRLILEDSDYEAARGIWDRLSDIGQLRHVLEEFASYKSAGNSDPTFAIGSEILHAAYRKLCENSNESILFAAGSRYGNIFTVERLVPLELEKSEVAYASADIASSSKALIEIERYGSLLTGYFHTHPGRGAGANHPSSIDLNNHARLEQGDYHTIGGIFSRDGYLRFFADKMRFQVSISGKGVECAGPNLWQLTANKDA